MAKKNIWRAELGATEKWTINTSRHWNQDKIKNSPTLPHSSPKHHNIYSIRIQNCNELVILSLPFYILNGSVYCSEPALVPLWYNECLWKANDFFAALDKEKIVLIERPLPSPWSLRFDLDSVSGYYFRRLFCFVFVCERIV